MGDRLKAGDTVLINSDIPHYGGLIGVISAVGVDECLIKFNGGENHLTSKALPNNNFTKLSIPVTTVEKFRKAKSEVISTKTKSDGGSSDYYFTKLPKEMIDQIVKTGGIEIKDIVSWVFYNDANIKDIVKALKRIKEAENGGGKEGTTIEYDLNKINFYVEEFKKYMLIKMKKDDEETTHD